jgi:hypothetical protein
MIRRILIPMIAITFFASVAFAADEVAAGAPDLIGKDFSGWKYKNEKASLWKIVSDVKMSDKNKKELEPTGEPGNLPILVNDLKTGQHGTDIYTEKEFGDCEVHVELMVPKGSNSGVYLMGRYEVQVFDSFGKKKPQTVDLGSIYATHAPDPEHYEPKAPGEWQTFDIVFQTPKFDATGKKTANAKFISVKLNGKEIQKDIDTPKPTGSELSSKEVATGPIMLQGDHGPVAFKNLRVKETR